MPIAVVPEALARLATKYETLARLRTDHGRGKPEASRADLRAVAADFPGALSELDTMELDEIVARGAALRRAADDPELVEPWMTWVFAYHASLREAFRLKNARTAADLETIHERSGVPFDEELLAALRARPKGRVVPSILHAIARWTGAEVDEIAEKLLPRRRSKKRASR